MNKLLGTFFIFGLTLIATAADQVGAPKTLKIESGGSIFGGTYTVELKNGQLHYTAAEGPGKNSSAVIVPTADQWATFRKDLDACNVWSWRNTKSRELDQRDWLVNIDYKDKKVDRSGYGKAPGHRGEFEKFKKAVVRRAKQGASCMVKDQI